MSVRWQDRVFTHSALERTQYLFMIVLGDDADSDGVSVMSAQEFANRIRTKYNPKKGRRIKKTVYDCIKAAELAGEIYVQRTSGVENIYLVCLGRTKEEITETLERRFDLDEYTAGMVADEKLGSQRLTREDMSLVPVTKSDQSSHETSLVTSHETSLVKRGNGSLPIKDQIITIRDSQEYSEMMAAVVKVCRFLDPLAIEEPDQGRIEVLVGNNVSPAEVLKYYSPGGWWQSYWKGKRGQRPTPKDIVETIIQAREGADYADAEAEFTAAWKTVLGYLKGRIEWDELTPRVQGMIQHFKESNLRKADKKKLANFRKEGASIWAQSPEGVDRT